MALAIEERARRKRENKLLEYIPYPKQLAFHAAGASFREFLFLAGNRVGKTEAGAHEMAFHLTGIYPAWWTGKRFNKPVRAWAAGVTSESTREVVQAKLFGDPNRQEEWGTGTIPRRCIGRIALARGIANAIDSVSIKHVTGGFSSLGFKSYERGREKWQGVALEVLWLDEEPPSDIYVEGLTRTNETGGIVYMTATPLLGMSDVMHRFLLEKDAELAGRKVVQASIEDAGHFTPEQRAAIIASYPAHEREARVKGIPVLGSGRVFPIEEARITVAAFAIPAHWPRLCGLDFGWDHPTAASWLAHDRDTDTIYVYDAYRVKEAPVVIHAAAIRGKGDWIPVAWPHDGNNDTAAGPNLAKQYRTEKVNMRPENAKFPETPGETDQPTSRISVEAGAQEMLTRMETGRWKVFGHLNDWFEEFRLYHRENGKIVKLRDDLLSASRIALMDLRFAITKPAPVRGITMTGWRG